MYISSIPCPCNDVNIAWVCTESNACLLVIHESNTQWYVVFTALFFKLDYGMYVVCRRVLAPKSCLFSRLIFI